MNNTSIGIDIVKLDRIEEVYAKFGTKFLERICNPWEIAYIKSRDYRAQTIASIFAMKEASSKAYGTGIGKFLSFKDIKIYYNDKGAPYGKIYNIPVYLSASHEKDHIVASALIENKYLDLSLDDSMVALYKSQAGDDFSHKGTKGKVMVIGSSRTMVGSGYLSSMAALRSGSGLVYHYVNPKDQIFDILSVKHIEVILRDTDPLEDARQMDSVLIGPGIGKKSGHTYLLESLLSMDIKLVVDADGLNAMAKDISILREKKSQVVLTPHIREFERLVGRKLHRKDYFDQAKAFAKKFDLTLVLKDYHTYVTNGDRSYLLKKPNSALSTPGSGDVLAGIIVSLLGQGHRTYDAAILGVYIHSLAGYFSSKANSKASTLASDLLVSLKDVFKELEN